MICFDNRKMNILFIMLLVFILLVNSFMFSVQTADAFAPAVLIPASFVADDVAAVCAALLVACGLQFDDEYTARMVGDAFYNCFAHNSSFKYAIDNVVSLFDSSVLGYVRVKILDYNLLDCIRSFLMQFYDVSTGTITVYNPAYIDCNTTLSSGVGNPFLYDTELSTATERRDLSNYTQLTADVYLRVVRSSGIMYVAQKNVKGNITTSIFNKSFTADASDYVKQKAAEYTVFANIGENTKWRLLPCYLKNIDSDFPEELDNFSNVNSLDYKLQYWSDTYESWFMTSYLTVVAGKFTASQSNYLWKNKNIGMNSDKKTKVTIATDTTYFPKGADGSDLFPDVGTSSKPLVDDIPVSIPTTIGGVVDFPLSSSRPFDVGLDVPTDFVTTGTMTEDVTTDGTSTITQFLLDIPILGDILSWIIRIATLVGDILNFLTSSISTGLDNIISGVKEGVSSLADSISGAVSATLEGVQSLIIPADFTWDNFINDLVAIVSPPESIDFRSYVNTIEIPDITVNYKGSKAVIVNNSMLRENISTFRSYIGAFLAVLLVIYNYNMFMKLMGYNGLSFGNSRTSDKKGDE